MTERDRTADILRQIHEAVRDRRISRAEAKEVVRDFVPQIRQEHVGALLSVLSLEDGLNWLAEQDGHPLLRFLGVDTGNLDPGLQRSLETYLLSKSHTAKTAREFDRLVADVPKFVEYADHFDRWDDMRDFATKAMAVSRIKRNAAEAAAEAMHNAVDRGNAMIDRLEATTSDKPSEPVMAVEDKPAPESELPSPEGELPSTNPSSNLDTLISSAIQKAGIE